MKGCQRVPAVSCPPPPPTEPGRHNLTTTLQWPLSHISSLVKLPDTKELVRYNYANTAHVHVRGAKLVTQR